MPERRGIFNHPAFEQKQQRSRLVKAPKDHMTLPYTYVLREFYDYTQTPVRHDIAYWSWKLFSIYKPHYDNLH